MNPGDLFENYRIVQRLAPGSMGQVYLAYQFADNKNVALKIVPGGPEPEQQERIEFARRGAAIQKDLSANDERIVKVYRVFDCPPDLAIVMEFVVGQDLATALKPGPFLPSRAALHARSLCTVLAKAGGLIHGDLKPRNVLLTTEDEIRVVDFGIAKLLEATRHGTFNPFRSPIYSSPERLDSSNVDANSDLWSIGVMLYEMIAGRQPYLAPGDLRRRILHGPPDPLPPNCPQPLCNVVHRMLSVDPRDRYQTASECASDLQRFLDGLDVPPPLRRADPNETVRTVDQGPRPPATPPVPRVTKSYAGRMGAVAAVVLVLIVFFLVKTWNAANDLSHRLEAHQADATEGWKRYSAMATSCKLTGLCAGLRESLRKVLVEDADTVIADFRNNDNPTAGTKDWDRAAQDFRNVLGEGFSGNSLSGRLYLCEGHLFRRQGKGSKALDKLRRAAELMPESVDPQLVMIWVYVYSRPYRFDKALEILQDVKMRGHAEGRREKAEMADALRGRGSESYGKDTAESLQAARQDLEAAVQLYKELKGFTKNVKASREDCERLLKLIEERLSTINSPINSR